MKYKHYLKRCKELVAKEPDNFNDGVRVHIRGHPEKEHVVDSKEWYEDKG
jgi:hypothetical protein